MLSPACPAPAVTAHRLSITPIDPLANTAMLEAPDPLVADGDVNPMSSNVTPVVSPVTVSAYPAVVGDTNAGLLASYVHVVQSSPPYTFNPSRIVPTVKCSAYVPPHAYTRLPDAFATSIACPIVASGELRVPALASLPLGDTNTPNPSLTTHASLVAYGSSASARQSPLHAW